MHMVRNITSRQCAGRRTLYNYHAMDHSYNKLISIIICSVYRILFTRVPEFTISTCINEMLTSCKVIVELNCHVIKAQ